MRLALATLAFAALVVPFAAPASAQSGNVTKCYVRGSFQAIIVSHGQTSAPQCQDLAIKCTGNPNVRSTFSTTPVIIHQAYSVCDAL